MYFKKPPPDPATDFLTNKIFETYRLIFEPGGLPKETSRTNLKRYKLDLAR